MEPRRVMTIDPMSLNMNWPIAGSNVGTTQTPTTGGGTNGGSTNGGTVGGTGIILSMPSSGSGGTGETSSPAGGGGTNGSGATEGGNIESPVIDWKKLLANAEEDYHSAIKAADDNFKLKMTSVSDVVKASQQQRDAQLADLKATADSQLQTVLNQIETISNDSNAARESKLDQLKQDLDAGTIAIDQEYETDTQAAKNDAISALKGIADRHKEATDLIDANFASITETAKGTLETTLGSVESTYRAAVDGAKVIFDGAILAAENVYTSATTAAWNSLNATATSLSASYTATLTAAETARDAALAGLSSGTGSFESSLAADSVYQGILSTAATAFNAEITSLIDGYRFTMAGLKTAYDGRMAAANTAYEFAITAADTSYKASVTSAFDGYKLSVDTAVDAFDTEVTRLQTAFDTQFQTASDRYTSAASLADGAYDRALSSARTAFETSIRTSRDDYEDFKTNGPTRLQDAIYDAAKAWATAVKDAKIANASAPVTASVSHATGVDAALSAVADLAESTLNTQLSDALNRVRTAAVTASATYNSTVSSGTGVSTSSDPMAAMDAYRLMVRNAVLDYLTTMVGRLETELGPLTRAAATELDLLNTKVNDAISQSGDADVIRATAIQAAITAVEKAEDVGHAQFMKKVADLQEAYFKDAARISEAYRNARTRAEGVLSKATATAVKDRSKAKAAAGKVYVDKVADEVKSYVDGYSDAWKIMREEFGRVATKLADDVAEADENWVTAANAADEGWVVATISAEEDYNEAASFAYEAVHNQAHLAVTNYVVTTRAGMVASLSATYGGDPDAATFQTTWSTYIDTVVSAWIDADGGLTAAENAYGDTESDASNTALRSRADAGHAAIRSEVAAEIAAMIAATDARRSYDTSYTNAAVDKAKGTVAEDVRKDKDSADAAKTENDKLANSYETAIHKADDLHTTVVTASATEMKGAEDGFVSGGYEAARALQQTGEDASNAYAAAKVAEVTDMATAMKGRIVAASASILSKEKAALILALSQAIAAFRVKLDALTADPNASVSTYQTAAGHGAIPFETEQAAVASSVAMIVQTRHNKKVMTQGMKQEIATDLATSIALGMTTGVLITVHAPNAEEVASKLAGSMKWPIYGSGTAHTYIGNYSVATGLVTRACSTASASGTTNVAGTFSLEYGEVMAEDAANPNNGEGAWNDFFGATPMTPPPDPDQQTVMYTALKFVVGEDRMAAPGGVVSDIALTLDFVTEAGGLVDPTGICDGLNAAGKLARGDVAGAGMAAASIVVPFGADKIAGAVRRVRQGAVATTKATVNAAAAGAGRTASKATANISEAGGKATASKAKAVCPDGKANCFVAGTQVVMNQVEEPVAVTPASVAVSASNEETFIAGGTGAIAVAAGVAAAIARAKLEAESGQGVYQQVTLKRRGTDGTTEPTLPPPDSERSMSEPVIAATNIAVRRPSKSRKPRRWMTSVLTAAMLLCFAVGGWCWSQVLLNPSGTATADSRPPAPSAGRSVSPSTRIRNVTTNIEAVRLGRRVVGRNPLREQTQSPSNIRPFTHRTIRLEMDQHGTRYELAFIRSTGWLDQLRAEVGHTIHLVMPEMGLDGDARVTAIDPCPPIEADDGTHRMIVTGTMKHLAPNVLDIEIAGELSPLGVTDTHPIWSEDRQDFVVAGQLQPGEYLRQSHGTLTQVTRITPKRGPPVTVYNLEVDGEHVYHVGQNGMLVHNACGDVLVDTNTVYDTKRINELIANGQNPLMPRAVVAELANNAAKSVNPMQVPRIASALGTSTGKPSIDSIINVRGKMQEIANRTGKKIKGNLVGDGQIGAEAVESGIPLITNDRLLRDAVNELGGNAMR